MGVANSCASLSGDCCACQASKASGRASEAWSRDEVEGFPPPIPFSTFPSSPSAQASLRVPRGDYQEIEVPLCVLPQDEQPVAVTNREMPALLRKQDQLCSPVFSLPGLPRPDLVPEGKQPIGAPFEDHDGAGNCLEAQAGDAEAGACPEAKPDAEHEALELCKSLQAHKAWARLGASVAARPRTRCQGEEDLYSGLRRQAVALEAAMKALRQHHPLLCRVDTERGAQSTATAPTPAADANSGDGKEASRDVIEVDFDLDDRGPRMQAKIEFMSDGSVAASMVAMDLPIHLTHAICMVNEVDLAKDLAPYVEHSGALHQFPWNEADKLVRMVSKPPIPLVAGLEVIAQRFAFDLLDTPLGGFCLYETNPCWRGSPPSYRGVQKPAPFRKGLKQVDVQATVALGRPSGPDGELTSVVVAATGDLKVPRRLLPNWLVTWLFKLIAKHVYRQVLDRVAQFEGVFVQVSRN